MEKKYDRIFTEFILRIYISKISKILKEYFTKVKLENLFWLFLGKKKLLTDELMISSIVTLGATGYN